MTKIRLNLEAAAAKPLRRTMIKTPRTDLFSSSRVLPMKSAWNGFGERQPMPS
jgi:hypothetical protein